ncbi:MAG: OmpH family outer membrane protein [Candidatus Babeliales bacterium]
MKTMTRFSITALCALTTAGLMAEAAKTTASTTTTPTPTTSASKTSVGQPCTSLYVNGNDLMTGTKKAKEENNKLVEKQKKLTADVQKIANELKGKMDELDGKKSTLSQSAMEKLQNEILALRGKYESTLQTADNQLKLEVQRATEMLSADAEAAGRQLAEAAKVDAVVDAISGRPIYLSEKVKNNTQELMKIMDKNYDTKKTKTA